MANWFSGTLTIHGHIQAIRRFLESGIVTKGYGFEWDVRDGNQLEVILPTHITHWIKGMTRAILEDDRITIQDLGHANASVVLAYRQANTVRARELQVLANEFGFNLEVTATNFLEGTRYEVVVSGGEITKNQCQECEHMLSPDELKRIRQGFTYEGAVPPSASAFSHA